MCAPTAGTPGKSLRVDPLRVDRGLNFFDQSLSKNDRMECELLEIIFTAPEMLHVIRREIGDEDFQNPQTRQVLQVCFDLLDLGERATFERITSVIEDVTLKRLLVWIDEQARLKEIAKKLSEDWVTDKERTLPHYLVQSLHDLRWRREEQLHQRAQGRLAQQPESRAGLTSNAKALLEQATLFHQKRAANTT